MKQLLRSSIGLKGLVALSGLFLVGFLIVHLLGNLLFYVGPNAFNIYGYELSKNEAIYETLEKIILIGFLSHIGLTAYTTYKNWRARPKKYAVVRRSRGIRSIFSSNMGLTGLIIFSFLIVHIRGFNMAEKALIPVPYEPGAMMEDLYGMLIVQFSDPILSFFYIVSVSLIGGHLSHGLQSAFKSLGIFDGRLGIFLKSVSISMGVLLAVGFGSIPFYVWAGLAN